nr:hypothetical protein [uncultured Kingella sp.]
MTQSIKITDGGKLEVTLSSGAKYTLREPFAKDLDGLSQDLIKIKHTDQVQKLLQKITTPALSRIEYGRLSLSDAEVFNAALSFFYAPPAAKAEMTSALAELGYLTESESAPQTSPE